MRVFYPHFILSTARLQKSQLLKMHQTIQVSYRLSAHHIFWPVTQLDLCIVTHTVLTILLEHETTIAHVIFGTIRRVWIETI